jgi:hypothetical protein
VADATWVFEDAFAASAASGRGKGSVTIQCVVPPPPPQSAEDAVPTTDTINTTDTTNTTTTNTTNTTTTRRGAGTGLSTVPFFLLWHGVKLDVFGRVATTTGTSYHKLNAAARENLHRGGGGGGSDEGDGGVSGGDGANATHAPYVVASVKDRYVSHQLMFTYTDNEEEDVACSCAAGLEGGGGGGALSLRNLGYPEWMVRVNEYRNVHYQCSSCGVCGDRDYRDCEGTSPNPEPELTNPHPNPRTPTTGTPRTRTPEPEPKPEPEPELEPPNPNLKPLTLIPSPLLLTPTPNPNPRTLIP